MKKIIPCFILCLFFFSCETETFPDNTTHFNSSIIQNRIPELVLENSLQWTAYVVTEVFAKNSSLRNNILNNLGENNAVDLTNLFEGGIIQSIFKEKFKEYLLNNIIDNGRPEGQRDRPGLPIGGSNGDHFVVPKPIEQVNLFMDYILNDHCIEIYIPNTLDLNATTIYSTGHPLNNNTYNLGFKNEYITGLVNNTYTSKIQTILPTEMQNNNVIIARPYREISEECDYNEYGYLDFTLFFN